MSNSKNHTKKAKDKDPKLHFYYLFSKWKWTRHFIPLKVFLWWNSFSYKHDALLYKIEQKWDKFTDFWFYPFTKIKWWYEDHVRGLSYRLKQSWAFIKLSWYDADWDYIYFLRVMKTKLERMEKLLRKNNRHVGTLDYCDQIKIVIDCLDFVIEDKTGSMMMDELHSKFPKERDFDNWLTRLRENRVVEMDDKGKKNVYFVSTDSSFENEDYRKEFKRLSYYYDSLKQTHLRLAFHIMLPALLTKEEYAKIEKENMKIYEKYGYDSEEALNLVKKIHHGIYSWWD